VKVETQLALFPLSDLMPHMPHTSAAHHLCIQHLSLFTVFTRMSSGPVANTTYHPYL